MITKAIKTTDGPLKVSIPSDVSEISLGMLISMQEDNSNLETIAILSGLSKETLYTVRSLNDLNVFEDHILSLAHQITYNCNDLPMPKFIMLKGKKVNVINNLSIEPVGAFMECRNIIADEINSYIKEFGEDEWKEHFKPSLESSALILAHYLYCPATGEQYSEGKAEAFKAEILKLSIVLTIPIAKHFFLNYPNLWREKQSFSKVLIQIWKKRRELKRSRRSGI